METTELSVDDKIKTFLLFYGVKEDFKFENQEEKELILMALSKDDIESVIIEDGTLCITYFGDEWEHE